MRASEFILGLLALVGWVLFITSWRKKKGNRQNEVVPNVPIQVKLPSKDPETKSLTQDNPALLAKVFRSSPAGLCVTDAVSGVFLDANEHFLSTFGFQLKEVIGKTSIELGIWFDPEDRNRLMARLRAENRVLGNLTRFRRKNGEVGIAHHSIEIIDLGSRPCLLTLLTDITQQERRAEALKRSEDRWQYALEGAGDGVWDYDLRTGKVFYSARWKSMLGYEAGDVGDTFSEWERLVHPEDLERAHRAFELHLNGHTPSYSCQLRMLHKDGKFGWVLTRGKIFERDAGGRPLRVIGMHTDIDERVETEKQLRASKASLDEAQRLANVGSWELDLTNFKVHWSRQQFLLHGLDPEGETPNFERGMSFIHPDDRSRIHQEFETHVTRGEDEFEYRHRFLLDGGRVVHIHGTVRVSRNERGQPIRMYGTSLDVTKLRQVEENLRFQESRLASIINSATDAIICVDESFRITLFNPGAEHIFGIRSGDAIGSHINRFIPDRYKAAHDHSIREFARSGESKRAMGRTGNIVGRRASGEEFPIEASISCAEVGGGRVLTSILRDLTEKTEAEKKQREIQDRLHQSQKMEAVGTLAGGIAHDFNNVLGVMTGLAGLLRMDTTNPEAIGRHLADLNAALERATELVRQILTFSRKQSVERHIMDPTPVLKEAVKMLRSTIPALVDIELTIGDKAPNLVSNPVQLHQVLINLVVNAADAMEGRPGRIQIFYGFTEINSEMSECSTGLAPGPYATLRVEDNGKGMDPSVLEHVFEPYFTTKELGKGTGLGLSMVHGIVGEHNGWIGVKSERGKGSVFTIYFPTTDLKIPARILPCSSSETTVAVRILYVDDEPALLDVASQILRAVGHHVTPAGSPVQALKEYANKLDEFDLVILDMTMPGMNGVDLGQGFWKSRASLPMILTSGFSEHITESKAKVLGFSMYLVKPFDADDLCEAVNRVMNTKPRSEALCGDSTSRGSPKP